MVKKNNSIKITLFLVIVLTAFFYSCQGKSWDLYKANRLAAKNDLPSLLEAKKIFTKYSSVELSAKESLKQVNISIGEVYFFDGKFKDALPFFLESLDIDPNQAQVNYYLGVCYANLIQTEMIDIKKEEDQKKALYHYKRAIEIAPEYATAHYALGVFYLYQMDDITLAKSEILKVLKIDPDHVRALFVFAQILYLQNDLQGALDTYMELLKKLPKEDSRIEQVKENIERINDEMGQ